jgi:predicted O-linked N-acetylglucosamine transferase (SPINDLY family)
MTVSTASDLLQEGLALHRRGAVVEAAARYAEVLRVEPGNADALYYLGMMSCQDGHFADGAEYARQSLACEPYHARAHVLLGRALDALGQQDEALTNFDRAVELAPDLAQAHGHRADLLSELGRNEEAVESYDRALALAPDVVEDRLSRGVTLIALSRYEEAVASFDRVLALKPDFPQAHLLYAPRLLLKLRVCDWSNLDGEDAQLLAMIKAQRAISVPFATLMIPATAAEQLQCARQYVQDQPAFPSIWRGERYSHDRIRVAYLSADFREHATAYLTAGLFEQHDKSRFEITAISLGQNDSSPMRRRLEAAFEHFIDVQGKSDQEVADLIRRLETDIVVDLMGFSKDNRLNVLARRPAPIQLNYLGYPGTLGADYIDYIFADPTVIPEDQGMFYAEQVVRLPATYQINDSKRYVAPIAPERHECGLPERAFVFCCFNNTQKLNPEMFGIWMRLLRAKEDSALWLLEGSPLASANLRAAAAERGVSPQRLVFAPKVSVADHLARQRRADLFLDTLPCNAHTTASDALWVGLPVVTCLGETFAGRVAGSLLKAIGLDELVAPSLQEYEALALKLAQDQAYLAAIKDKLARNRDTSILFDTKRATRHIESAYLTMVDILRRDESPRSFAVEPA